MTKILFEAILQIVQLLGKLAPRRKNVMGDDYVAAAIEDRGGRRSGIDRRRLLIPSYSPERRSVLLSNKTVVG